MVAGPGLKDGAAFLMLDEFGGAVPMVGDVVSLPVEADRIDYIVMRRILHPSDRKAPLSDPRISLYVRPLTANEREMRSIQDHLAAQAWAWAKDGKAVWGPDPGDAW